LLIGFIVNPRLAVWYAIGGEAFTVPIALLGELIIAFLMGRTSPWWRRPRLNAATGQRRGWLGPSNQDGRSTGDPL
jgi:hypothetical protein